MSFGSGPAVRMAIDDPRFFRRLATGPRFGLGESYQAGEWRSDDLPGLLELLIGTPSERRRGTAPAPLRRAAAAAQPPYRPARRRPERPLPLRPRQRALLALPRRDVDVLVRRLRARGRVARRGTASQVAAGLREARARARRPRARDRLRLGLFRPRRGRGVRRARDRDHPLSRPGRPGAAPRRRGRAGRPRRGPRPGLPRGRRGVHEGGLDRDARGDRREALRRVLRHDRPRARRQRTRLRPDDPRSRTRATAATARHPDWIERYVFPGCLIPSLGALRRRRARSTSATSRKSGSTTARRSPAGARRSSAGLGEVRALGYDERFVRTWDFYLASCEALFRVGLLRDVQLVVAR